MVTVHVMPCIECERLTEQTCLWCKRPLHRHHGQVGNTGDVNRAKCWYRHRVSCGRL